MIMLRSIDRRRKESSVKSWLFVAVAAVAVPWSLPSAGMAQAHPADAMNPPWKNQASSALTPRTPDGKPDLTGSWQRGQSHVDERFGETITSDIRVDEKGNIKAAYGGRGTDDAVGGTQGFADYERDSGVSLRSEPNMPLYKPEFWDRVQWLDENGNLEDPELVCKPYGVPRMGPPDRIVQSSKELLFFYSTHNTFRIIPFNKPLPPVDQWEGTSWKGTSSARWDGDTLVIESVDFTEESWLGFGGYFHSVNMKVTERYSRKGNLLMWEATVDDPQVFIKPWVQNPWYLQLKTKDPIGFPKETLPCGDHSFEHFDPEKGATKERG
jgi:hypothetical protein